MGTFLGNGYALWKPTFTLDGSVKIFQTAIMIKYNTISTPALVDAELRNAFIGTGKPFAATQMWIGYTLARTEVYYQSGGDLLYNLNETAVTGTKSGSLGTPINTSIIVQRKTGLVGKRYRGRIMLPNLWVQESDIDQAGIIASGAVTSVQALWTSAFNALDAGPSDLVLGHTSSEILPTTIISLTVNQKIGSMPHRIR